MIYINEMPPFWADVLGVDLETTSLDPHEGRILSITLSDGRDSWIFLHWFKFDCLKDVLEDEKVIKIYHNAQFDLSFIKVHLGFEVQNIYDSMLAEQVLIAARDMDANLADVTARRVGSFMTKEVRETFYNHPGFHIKPVTQDQIEYMADDVVILPKIRESQLKEAEETNCTWTIEIENNAVAAFAEMSVGGYRLDVDRWYEYLKVFNEKVDESELKLRELLGKDYVLKFMNKSKDKPVEKVYTVDEINLGSAEQLKKILKYKYNIETDTTNEKFLLELSNSLDDDNPARVFIDELLVCRHWKKCITWDYPRFVHPNTGKIHSSKHQIGTDTGRPSESKPNNLQVPKPVPNEPNFRQLWTADDEDCVLISADYSQQEVRVMADLSKDAMLIEACNQRDVYLYVGKLMYNKEIKKTDPERQYAKIFTLSIGFRVGLGQLRRQSGVAIERCKEIRNIIWKTFPKMKTYAELCEGYAKRNSYVFTVTGRRRYFTAKNRIYTEAVNTPVQGTATDMTKIALGNVYKTLTEWKKAGTISPKSRLWHFLYDELVVQCHKDDVDKVTEMVVRTMESAGKELCPSVSHIAEAHHGYQWDK